MGEDEPTVGQARAARFDATAAGPIGYGSWLIRLDFAGVPLPVPNPPGHGAALMLHDIHHVLTGYGTDLVGEGEISAWELGAGWGPHLAAAGFVLGGTALGVLVAPRRAFRAFVRGRRSRSLYRRGLGAADLDRPVSALRADLGLDAPAPHPTRADRAAFAAWALASAAFVAAMPLSIAATAAACLLPPPRDVPPLPRAA